MVTPSSTFTEYRYIEFVDITLVHIFISLRELYLTLIFLFCEERLGGGYGRGSDIVQPLELIR
jgi:hypothetical protein